MRDAKTRKLPAQPDAVPGAMGPRALGAGALGAGTRGPGVRVAGVQGARDLKNPRRRRPPGRAALGLGRWGSLQGGLGVCFIVASTAIGAIATMATGSVPGLLLGVFVIIGTVVAALAVRPSAGRMILPAPVLCYLVAALLSGVIYDRSDDSSKAALAIGGAQWIANGFFAMAIATIAAIVLIAVRWFIWRRQRRAPSGPGPYNFSSGA